MDTDEYQAPFEPEQIAPAIGGAISSFCVSPTNGRLEWIQAHVKRSLLNSGSGITDSMSNFLLAGDKNPGDKPALLIHASLGGRGDDVYNIFLEGRSFDRDTFNNEVESTVYYALKDRKDDEAACITIRLVFRNQAVMRPYRLRYHVELPGGDVIENELANV